MSISERKLISAINFFNCCPVYRKRRVEKWLNDSLRKQYDRSSMGTFHRWNSPDFSKSQCHNKCLRLFQKQRDQTNQMQCINLHCPYKETVFNKLGNVTMDWRSEDTLE